MGIAIAGSFRRFLSGDDRQSGILEEKKKRKSKETGSKEQRGNKQDIKRSQS